MRARVQAYERRAARNVYCRAATNSARCKQPLAGAIEGALDEGNADR